MPELKIVLGPGAPRTIELPLGEEEWVVGTGPSCQVVLEDDSVQERHARIRRRGLGYVIEPAGEGGDFELNGATAESAIPLHDEDEILLGQTTMRWHPGDAIEAVAMGGLSLEDSISGDGLVMAPAGLMAPRPYVGVEITSDHGAGYRQSDGDVITGDHLMDAVAQAVAALRSGRSVVPETTLASLSMAFGADRALLFLPFGGERPRLLASFLGPAELGADEGITDDLLAEVKDAGIPVTVNVSSASIQIPGQPAIGGGSLRSLMAVPVLTARGEGSLVLDAPMERKQFQEEDLAVLTTFAGVLGHLLDTSSRISRMEELIENWSESQARRLRAIPRGPRALEKEVARAADAAAPVLVVGEPGAGKLHTARRVHAMSTRAAEPFLGVDCARSEDLAAEIFGRMEDGQITVTSALEHADRGALVLHHVTALPVGVQKRLEEFLASGAFELEGEGGARSSNARLIFTSDQDPAAEGGAGWFRSSLLERIPEECRLVVPPLREVPKFLQRVATRVVRRAARRYKRPVKEISPEALELLLAQRWPANHRSLVVVLEACVRQESGEALSASTLRAVLDAEA